MMRRMKTTWQFFLDSGHRGQSSPPLSVSPPLNIHPNRDTVILIQKVLAIGFLAHSIYNIHVYNYIFVEFC